MNENGMSRMNRFLMTILIILILLIAGLVLGIYYVKSSSSSGWQLPKSSVSGNAVYGYENEVGKVESIGNVCREGQKRCFGPGYIECSGKKGSLNWGKIKYCDKNQTCSKGECIDGY